VLEPPRASSPSGTFSLVLPSVPTLTTTVYDNRIDAKTDDSAKENAPKEEDALSSPNSKQEKNESSQEKTIDIEPQQQPSTSKYDSSLIIQIANDQTANDKPPRASSPSGTFSLVLPSVPTLTLLSKPSIIRDVPRRTCQSFTNELL
jgi:hypothetical protein